VDFGDGSGVQPLTLSPDKTFTLSHAYADNGLFIVTVTVSDDKGGSGSDSFTVTVSNMAPTASHNTYSTAQAVAVSGNLITDGIPDRDLAGANDPLVVIAKTAPSNGAVVMYPDGTFTYQPDRAV
jgi:PKD repeat protein